MKLISNYHGLKLEPSILSFDTQALNRVNFLSSPFFSRKTPVGRMIASEPTADLSFPHRSKRKRSLICPFHHRFSIGEYDLELLPAGSVLGGSSLFIRQGDRSILYAPIIETTPRRTSENMVLRHAKTLVLGAWRKDSAVPSEQTCVSSPSVPQELISDLHTVIRSSQQSVLIADVYAHIPEILAHLEDVREVTANRYVQRILRIYQRHGKLSKTLKTFDIKKPGKSLLLWPRSHIDHMPSLWKQSKNIFFIDDHLARRGELPSFLGSAKTWIVRHFVDDAGFLEIIKAVSSEKVYFYGPYAQATAQRIAPLFPKKTIAAIQPYKYQRILG